MNDGFDVRISQINSADEVVKSFRVFRDQAIQSSLNIVSRNSLKHSIEFFRSGRRGHQGFLDLLEFRRSHQILTQLSGIRIVELSGSDQALSLSLSDHLFDINLR